MCEISAVIVAAGESTRFGSNKIFSQLFGRYLVEYALRTFDAHTGVSEIILVLNEKDLGYAGYFLSNYKKVKKVVAGGKARQDSVRNGVLGTACNYVLVHDGARPNVSAKVIDNVINGLKEYDAVVPAIPVRDTVGYGESLMLKDYATRENLYAIQTPQGFKKDLLLKALEKAKKNYTDESTMVYDVLGYSAKLVEGSLENVKITYIEDVDLLERLMENRMEYRIGMGWDSHRLAEGKKLILGGILITEEIGTIAHSDGDCLIHVIIDALLGASGEKDIGTIFPDTDPRYAGVSSMTLLDEVWQKVKKGVEIVNIDCIVKLERPKIFSYVESMKASIASVLDIDPGKISIKAKTGEKTGPVGESRLIECEAVVLVRLLN